MKDLQSLHMVCLRGMLRAALGGQLLKESASSMLGPVFPILGPEVPSEPSLDALSLRSDVISSINILALRQRDLTCPARTVCGKSHIKLLEARVPPLSPTPHETFQVSGCMIPRAWGDFEPSLDALSLRSDVVSSFTIICPCWGESQQGAVWFQKKTGRHPAEVLRRALPTEGAPYRGWRALPTEGGAAVVSQLIRA